MESFNALLASLDSTLQALLPAIFGYLPSLFGALAILVVGWLVARLIRAAAQRILSGLNRVLERMFQTGLLESIRVPLGASSILGEVAFWVIIFSTLTLSARVAQLPAISNSLHEIVLFIPEILFGLSMIGVGYLISAVVAEQVEQSTRSANSSQSRLLGLLAQGAVFLIASIIGLNQIGVDVTFLIVLSSVAIAAVLLAFSMAFGLGSRDYMRNLISARSLRRTLSAGLLLRIGDVEGELLEITQTHIALDTEHGRALVPAHIAEKDGVLIISLNVAAAGDNA